MAVISEWRAMWMIVMFDLPVKTRLQKTRYRRFHDFLLDNGFMMMQYSIYGRHCLTREKADVHARRIKIATPKQGEVRILRVTEAQFGKMQVFKNFELKKAEQPPLPLEFW